MQLIFWLLFKPYQHSLINSLCNQMVKIYTKLQYTKLKQNSNKNPNHAIILHYHVGICTAYRITVYKVWFLTCVFSFTLLHLQSVPPPFNMPRHRNVKDKLRCSNSLSLKFAQCQRQKGWKWKGGKYFYVYSIINFS